MNSLVNAWRDRLARRLHELGRRLATEAGWAALMERQGLPSMRAGLLALRRDGFVPRVLVDGGACKGEWTMLARAVFPEARVLMIEPQRRHREALERVVAAMPGTTYAPALIGPEERASVDFFVLDDAGGGTGSSVLEEQSDVPRHVEQVPMTTLDRVIESSGFEAPQLIKLDVQGYELEVLSGARLALTKADFVLLEVSAWPYNAGSPLIANVLEWMKARGFRTYDVWGVSRRPDGRLVQMDLLFIRETHPWLADVTTRFGT